MTLSNTYTLNKLQMYDECPQKYKLCYLDKIHIAEPIVKTQTGNNIHKLIEYNLKGHDISKLIDALTQQEKLLWSNFKNSEFLKYNCIYTEHAFNIKLDNYWLTGRIDALFKNREQYIIADWKTGENFTPDNVKFQTGFYLLCMYEILFAKGLIKKQEELSLQYFNLVTNNIINIKFDENTYLQYRQQFLKLINKINENTMYFCNKTDKCKYCKYYRACPYY